MGHSVLQWEKILCQSKSSQDMSSNSILKKPQLILRCSSYVLCFYEKIAIEIESGSCLIPPRKVIKEEIKPVPQRCFASENLALLRSSLCKLVYDLLMKTERNPNFF